MRNTLQTIGTKPDGDKLTITLDPDLAEMMQAKLGDTGSIRQWVQGLIASGHITDSRSARLLIYSEIVKPAVLKKVS